MHCYKLCMYTEISSTYKKKRVSGERSGGEDGTCSPQTKTLVTPINIESMKINMSNYFRSLCISSGSCTVRHKLLFNILNILFFLALIISCGWSFFSPDLVSMVLQTYSQFAINSLETIAAETAGNVHNYNSYLIIIYKQQDTLTRDESKYGSPTSGWDIFHIFMKFGQLVIAFSNSTTRL